jgi:SecD/SecF fusion protein
VHWKEREPGFRARHDRIMETLGEVPPYATVAQGGPVDVTPKSRGRRRVTTPAGAEVSQTEFQEMVRDLGVDEEQRQPAAATSATSSRPAGGRRAKARANGMAPPAGSGAAEPAEPPAEEPTKERKPRNRRHGRPR